MFGTNRKVPKKRDQLNLEFSEKDAQEKTVFKNFCEVKALNFSEISRRILIDGWKKIIREGN